MFLNFDPKNRSFLLIPAVTWGFLILFLTLRPKSDSTAISLPLWISFLPIDKLAHFIFWGIWYGLFHVFYLQTGLSKKSNRGHFSDPATLNRHRAYGIITMILIGGIIEILQHQLQWGREAEWWDWAADTSGVLLSLGVFKGWRFFTRISH